MSTTAELLQLLDLETLEDNLFRGRNPPESWPFRTRVFGGQVLAQALVAAQRTVDLAAHSLHAYFLLAGDPSVPILYEVERVRDGRSFATRRTVAIQHGRPIFIMSVSFHREEPGLDHQIDLEAEVEGEVPAPEDVPGLDALAADVLERLPAPVRDYWLRPRPIELKPIGLGQTHSVPRRMVWFRAAATLPDAPDLHRAVLAYATDMTLLEATTLVHGTSVLGAGIQAASLDHALWIHRPFRADGWLLYVQDSPSASGARGLARGLIYDERRRLVASVAQEGLIRPIGKVSGSE
ncbi:acyl-CoA thioesterase [Ancylobacter amanitiformis]|uniref:Acyl-CoA thioesterase-2 n=1 Tax=Ancylobacter amanitiformis TaxID=217069 RepID=A0ABU0LRL3_9HYPH|nr:acyl-CoA thioesterase II [Ancylobacter amanitiformis]MDQ0511345.1 acyl-CoA thioesterase-2 [Ancylobacter amanitiformis]